MGKVGAGLEYKGKNTRRYSAVLTIINMLTMRVLPGGKDIQISELIMKERLRNRRFVADVDVHGGEDFQNSKNQNGYLISNRVLW
jgi:hypothetical protein